MLILHPFPELSLGSCQLPVAGCQFSKQNTAGDGCATQDSFELQVSSFEFFNAHFFQRMPFGCMDD